MQDDVAMFLFLAGEIVDDQMRSNDETGGGRRRRCWLVDRNAISLVSSEIGRSTATCVPMHQHQTLPSTLIIRCNAISSCVCNGNYSHVHFQPHFLLTPPQTSN